MINFDVNFDNINEHTAKDIELKVEDNKQKQRDMRKDLYCMWFPDNKPSIKIARLALHDIDLVCDKIVNGVTLNNMAGKSMDVDNAFRKLEKKLEDFSIRFDEEYIKLKREEVLLAYQLKWAIKVAKDLERDRREILKEQEREERKLLKDREKAERKLSDLKYEYIKRTERNLRGDTLEDITDAIVEQEETIQHLDYSLSHVHAGYCYVVSNNDMKDGYYKIGITRRDISERMRELSGAGHAFEMNVHGYVFCENVFDVETAMHRYLAKDKVNKTRTKKEWFKTTLRDIEAAFKEACDIDITLKDVVNEEYIYARSIDGRI